ncbi:MAG: MFS transporter [Burkholderiales bacterium]|nr:MFS transporter [Burkholderiales bacterium]
MKHRPYYGWIVVAATHVALAVVFAVAYSFAAFFSAFEAEFAASRGDVSLVFAISGFLYFLIGAFAGALSDRLGPRRVALAGVAALAIGLAAAARAPSLAALYATYSIGVGLGVGFVYVPSVGAVQPWFLRHRALASGLAVAGIGLGTLVGPLLAAWLLEAFGWRRAFEALAIGAAILGGAAAALLDNRPARHGVGPDGGPPLAPRAGASPAQPAGLTLREAVRTKPLWLLYAATLFSCAGLFIPFAHLAPYARDAGHPATTGVLLVGLIGVGSLVGRFAFAGIGDRFGRAQLLAFAYGGMAAMFALWLVSTGALALGVFAVVFGTCYGVMVALAPALVMDLFGARSIAGILGFVYTAAGVGNLVGPAFAGYAFDLAGSYAVPIAAGIVFNALAVGASLTLARLARPARV